MLKKIWKFKIVSSVFALSLGLVVGGWLWAYFTLRKIPQPLIIHFNNYAGINQVGGLSDLNAIGLFGLAAVILDFLIALELEEKDWFWGKFLTAGMFFLSVLIFLGFAAIISVN